MISRKTAKAIAEAYDSRFLIRSGRTANYIVNRDAVYDFLFENDYEPWFMNLVRYLGSSKRALHDLILRLHTGESLAPFAQELSRDQLEQVGQLMLRKLSEDILQYYTDADEYVSDATQKAVGRMQAGLELDGFQFQAGKLYATELAVIEEQEEEGALRRLISALTIPEEDVISYHLELSREQYIAGNWSDSISNSRKYLESILKGAAARYHLAQSSAMLTEQMLSKPYQVRDYLETSGLLVGNEKETVAKVYGLLSETGGHPYIAEKDQARLMQHLALIFSQFILLRLQGALATIPNQ